MNQQNFKDKIKLYINNLQKRQIPKFLKIYFLALLFVLGLDFGFINVVNKKIRSFSKLLSIVISILVFTHLLSPVVYEISVSNFGFYALCFYQYAMSILVLHTAKYNVYHFIKDVYKVHNKTYDKEYRFFSSLLAYNFIISIVKMIQFDYICKVKVFYCFTISSVIPVHTYGVSVLILDIVAFVQILVYYYVHSSLKYLRELMENKSIDLINARKQFIMIADCCDNIGGLYGKLVSVAGG